MHVFVRGSALLLAVGDLATFFGALVLTLLIRYREIPSDTVIEQHLTPFLVLFVIWALVFLIAGLYDRRVLFARKRITSLVARVQVLNVLLAAVFFFIFPFGIEPKTNLVIYLGISTVLVVSWRLYIFPVLATGKPMNVLVIGDSKEANGIARVFVTNPYFKNIHAFTLGSKHMESASELRESLLKFVKEKGTELIIADMRDPYTAMLTKDFYSLSFEFSNVQFFSLPAMYEQLYHRVPPSLIAESWILENITTSAPHYAYDFLKRLVDIVGALVLLVPALLIFPFIALLIKLDDGGPLFYKTERIGQYNKVISIMKFRTMTGRDVGVSALQSTLVVTRVGKLLRKTRLDELPQLINVFRGDLSFIGPRPEMPALAKVYTDNIPYYNLRHLIKPGLSGWAQINNFDVPRGGVDIERTIDKLSFDLYYLKHRSILLDLEIALKTINTLLMRTGT